MRDLAPDARGGERFAASSAVRLLRLKDRAALFCARRQQLYALNDTALLIWDALAAGETVARTSARLEALGVNPAEARAYVETAAEDWTREGYLATTAALDRCGRIPDMVRNLVVDGFQASLRLHGHVPTDGLDAAFDHLSAHGPGIALDVVALPGRHALFVAGVPRGEVETGGLVPAIKALLTELYADAVADGFLTHGALLRRDGKTLFLTGEPGAGKTTLTLALAAAGFAYGGDDIVRIGADGLARPAPFAAAAKSGAWDLLAARMPDLAKAPVHRRADGQLVRYLRPASLEALPPAPLDVVLLLQREADAAPALKPVHPLDALVALLDSAFSRKGAAEGETLSALASRLEAAACFRLTYSDLDRAVVAVEGLL